jgi:hypothetical protein
MQAQSLMIALGNKPHEPGKGTLPYATLPSEKDYSQAATGRFTHCGIQSINLINAARKKLNGYGLARGEGAIFFGGHDGLIVSLCL